MNSDLRGFILIDYKLNATVISNKELYDLMDGEKFDAIIQNKNRTELNQFIGKALTGEYNKNDNT